MNSWDSNAKEFRFTTRTMNTEQKFNCIFCKDVFDTREELQTHFRKHADPEFKSRNRFEMVSCDVCTQTFSTISKAITHKHKVHPDHDVKYFCPWCGKLFTMKHPYNVHIQTTHANQEQTDEKLFRCDCCEVDFYLPAAMKYHNKFFHQQDTDIPDVGMSKKLKLYNQETLPIFYCAFCGDEYENKVNLFKHLTDDHSDENQIPDEVLRCPLCEAIFYHLDAYEIHLSFHTTGDLYTNQNELFASLEDFSLESVPPVIEKVENKEELDEDESQDPNEKLNINAEGIEKFLELAMDNEDSNPGKVKKKKHKKSKKAAITLDEFLSMNQDVFGEDLEFQGVEDLPTRVVKKRAKNNKKAVNAVTSAEVEKLKQQGIVVMKVRASKATKTAPKKMTAKRELKTSSEVLTKLINQSNNQIKIVKKSVPKVNINDVANSMEEGTDVQNDTEIEPNGEFAENSLVEEEGNFSTKQDKSPLNSNKDTPLTKDEDRSLSPSSTDKPSGVDNNTNSNKPLSREITEESNCTSNQNTALNTTPTSNTNLEKKIIPLHDVSPRLKEHDKYSEPLNSTMNKIDPKIKVDQRESDYEESDSEMIDRDNVDNMETDLDDIEGIGNEHIEERIEPKIKPVASSLSTLKHLGHLTIKPVNQNNSSPELTAQKNSDGKFVDKTPLKVEKEQTLTDTENTTKQKPVTEKDPTLDALKILSKNITIKSLPSSVIKNVNQTDANEEDEVVDTNNVKLKDISGNKNVTIKKIKIEPNEPASTNKVINMSNSAVNIQSLKPTNKVTTLPIEALKNKEVATSSPSKANILKHLPNITTTPIPSKKPQQPQVVKQTTTSVNTTNTSHKEQEIIEISDIDDSDDETDYKPPAPKQDTKIGVGALKNLSKHITVKPLNQPTQSVPKTIKVEKSEEHTDDEDFDDNVFDEDDVPYIPKVCSQKLATKNFALKNALKNLGKNITVKSGTSSPCQSNKSQDNYPQHSNVDINEPEDDDSDTEIGKVKITELEDDNISNHDDYEDNYAEPIVESPHDSCDSGNGNNEPIVESPHDSCSENDEVDNDPVDFESKINTSQVLKVKQQESPADKNTLCLNNLKNISKNLTIKSLSANSTVKQENLNPTSNQESAASAKNPSVTGLAAKPTKNLKDSCNEESSTSKSFQKTPNVDQASNESMNQKVSVNKEVTVKTFQTKTVIQEITTTVTKTIKTVNQSVKQESRNSNQMCIPVTPQKVQGMRPNMSKNLQGVVIRQAAPTTVRPNNVNQTRPALNIVRPKQVIQTRPVLNVRPSTPRMPNAKTKTNLPKSSPNQQVIGKPLKFSPSAMVPITKKRPSTEDASGPFSCFKKPKESLIPVSELPSFAGGGETVVHMKAASQTSNNYMSTSKVVKGNSIVTATQMKSEVSSTMQQLSRLGNVSVKVKSAQMKQSQETKTCSKERTTLDAIEKLQKQGLLVKKPRIELSENSEFDELDDNVDVDYSSEQDE